MNWLAFLNKYNLHGILCDDMGLGKTLMSICILAGDYYYREKAFEVNLSVVIYMYTIIVEKISTKFVML